MLLAPDPPLWAQLLTPRLPELTTELARALGPMIRTVTITCDTTRHQLVVQVRPLGIPLPTIAWHTAVELAPLWPNAFADAQPALAITDHRRTITTSHRGMVAIGAGATRHDWHPTHELRTTIIDGGTP